MDAMGDRLKLFESIEASRKLLPLLPVMARIDGRSFSNFTSGLNRPYDVRMSECMIRTTEFLVKETNALCGYTQSDEISLVLYEDNLKSKIFFDGKIQKLTSNLASLATVFFYKEVCSELPEYAKKMPTFDARVWVVPNLVEGANTILWRELDCSKNSISMAARENFSPKQMHKKTSNQLQEMLFQKGINWNDYPSSFKRGTFVQRRTVKRKFDSAIDADLAPKHFARTNPDLIIERSQLVRLDMPKFSTVTNRVGVVFYGEDPHVV